MRLQLCRPSNSDVKLELPDMPTDGALGVTCVKLVIVVTELDLTSWTTRPWREQLLISGTLSAT
jgi:hypothetical protein